MKLAIIGFGPRGLYILECIIEEVLAYNTLDSLQIHIYDDKDFYATGKAWRIQQPESNLINISDRALQDLPKRKEIKNQNLKLKEFPNYHKWCIENNLNNTNEHIDAYPPRSQMGNYLHQRAASMIAPLIEKGIVQFYNFQITQATWENNQFILTANKGKNEKFDVCIVTIGHTNLEKDEEQLENEKHATVYNLEYFDNPYTSDLEKKDFSDKNVAIIGLGLTMIDVIRMLVLQSGAHFMSVDDHLEYVSEHFEPPCIVPYSFDGLPCVPKPIGRKVDKMFTPNDKQLYRLRNGLEETINSKKQEFTKNDFIDIMRELIFEMYVNIYPDQKYSTLNELIEKWIADGDNDHELFLDPTLDYQTYVAETVDMARGTVQPSLDYFIGQVWRHCHPTLYRVFAFPDIPSKTMSEIIEIDERIKRYSYGPPVESMLQQLALIKQGVLNVDFVNDPEIDKNQIGWTFTKGKNSIAADTLINTVLDNPNFQKMKDPLITSLQDQHLIKVVYEGLGILTTSNSVAINDYQNIPLYILGRDIKGSVLGTDAILECFSPEIKKCARHIISQSYKY